MDLSGTNQVIESAVPLGATLAEIHVTPVPIEINMNKLIGSMLVRLTQVERQLAQAQARITALEGRT